MELRFGLQTPSAFINSNLSAFTNSKCVYKLQVRLQTPNVWLQSSATILLNRYYSQSLGNKDHGFYNAFLYQDPSILVPIERSC